MGCEKLVLRRSADRPSSPPALTTTAENQSLGTFCVKSGGSPCLQQFPNLLLKTASAPSPPGGPSSRRISTPFSLNLQKCVITKSAKGSAAAASLQSSLTLCDPIDGSPPASPHPWESPGKNTGVGCHFLVQCMKVKSEREVAQLCPTLRNPMDCSPPGSSIHGIFQARVLGWGAITFSMHFK